MAVDDATLHRVVDEKVAALKTEIIGTLAREIACAALSLLEKDMHSWSPRPCTTCNQISTLIGKKFGCVSLYGTR